MLNPLPFYRYLYYNKVSYDIHYSKFCLWGEFNMAKKALHNLNKRKGTKILLLIMALSFVVVPVITLIISIMDRLNMSF